MKSLFGIILIACILLSSKANAGTQWVNINDASHLKWQITSNGTVWFRNIKDFNSAHNGCCYSYKLDATTAGGKVLWTTLLAKISSSKGISLGFTGIGTNEAPQTLVYVGEH